MFLVNNATPAIAASVYCFSTLGGKSSVSVTSSPIESKILKVLEKAGPTTPEDPSNDFLNILIARRADPQCDLISG